MLLQSLSTSVNKCFLSSLTTSVQLRCPSSTKAEQNKVRRDRQTLYHGLRPRTAFPPGQPDQSSQHGAWGLSCRSPSSCPPHCPLASDLKATTNTVCVKKKDCVCVCLTVARRVHTHSHMYTHTHVHSHTAHTSCCVLACATYTCPISQAHMCTHTCMCTLSTMHTHAHAS